MNSLLSTVSVDLVGAVIPNPTCVTPEASFSQVVALMGQGRSTCSLALTANATALVHISPAVHESRSSCVLVLEEDVLVGILTERDVVKQVVQGRSTTHLTVREVMSTSVVCLPVWQFTDVFVATNLLRQHGIRHLPLVDREWRVLGLLTHESLQQLLRPIDLLRLRQVGEVMVTKVICAPPEASVLAISQAMVQNKVSSVVITQTITAQIAADVDADISPDIDLFIDSSSDLSIDAIDTIYTYRNSKETHQDHYQNEAQDSLTELLNQTSTHSPETQDRTTNSTQATNDALDRDIKGMSHASVRGDLRQPIGIITERDIVQFHALGLNFEQVSAQTVMSSPVFSVPPQETLSTVLKQMQERRLSRLVVVGHYGELLGIVTQSTLLNILNPAELFILAESLEQQVAKLESEKIQLLERRADELEVKIKARTVELQVKAEQERLIGRISNRIRKSLDLQAILNATVAEVRSCLDCDRVLIYRCGSDQQDWVMAESVAAGYPVCLNEVCVGLCEAQAELTNDPGLKTMAIADIRDLKASPQRRQWLECFQVKSKLIAPIYLGSDSLVGTQPEPLWGWLVAHQCDKPRNWLRGEKQILQQLAVQVSIAIQQSIALQQTRAELSERKRAEETLRAVLEGTAAVTGETFFPELVRHIASALKVRHAIISQVNENRWETLAVWSGDRLQANFCIPLGQSLGLDQSLCYGNHAQASQVQETYPDHPLFSAFAAESYSSIGLTNSAGEPIGSLCILHDHPLESLECIEAVLRTFAARAGGEIERLQTAQELARLNRDLEARVRQRTAQLQQREDELQDFLDNANDLIQSVALDTGRFEYVNRAWQETLGYSAEEVQSLTMADVLHPYSVGPCQVALRELQAGRLSTIDRLELTFLTRTGRKVTVEGSLNCRLAEGRPVSSRAIFRNVTERKRTENQLRASEARYRALLDGASDAILLADHDGQVVEINRQAQELLGYSRQDLTDLFLVELYADDDRDRAAAAFQSLETQQAVRLMDVQVITRDRQMIPVDLTAAIVTTGGQDIIQAILRDIRSRKRAEAALQAENAFRQQIVENMAEGLCVCQDTGSLDSIRFTVWNRQMREITGYTIEEINQTMGWSNLLAPEPNLRARALGRLARIRAGDHVNAEEWQIQRPDGEDRVIAISTSSIANPDGHTYVLALIQDVSDRHRTEKRLRSLSERLSLAIASGGFGIWEYDFLEQRQIWDQRMGELYGLAPDQYPQDTEAWLKYLHPDDRDGVLTAMGQAVAGQQDYNVEFRIIQPTGDTRFMQACSVFQRDETGQPVRVIGLNFDVTAQKTTEATLKRQLAAIEAAIDGIAILDNTVHHYVNHSKLKLFGYDRASDLVGQPWRKLYPIEELARFDGEIFPDLAAAGHWQGEVTALRQDGSQFAEGLSLTLTEGGLIISVGRDISDRKDYEARLEQTNAELARATRLKDEFLANMSHELRTPLNAILGMTEGLQDEVFGILNRRQQRALSTIENSGRHLLDLINDILDLAKIEAGKLELHTTPVSIRYLCESSLPFIKHQALKKRITLNLQIQDNLNMALLDEQRLRQVLINLLGNAAKFTLKGGSITLSASLETIDPSWGNPQQILMTQTAPGRSTPGQLPRSTPANSPTSGTPRSPETPRSPRSPETPGIDPGTKAPATPEPKTHLKPAIATSAALPEVPLLCLAVTDSGIGIAPEDLQKLFQTFVQIDSSLNRQQAGTGLGLSLVRRIVELHGGFVSVSSTVGQGSCFRVYLPYHPGETLNNSSQSFGRNLELSAAPAVGTSPDPAPPSLLLLAEDNPANVSTISSYLESRGYEIVVASNGHEAVAIAQTRQPNLILMDVQMPGLDGLAATRLIRAEPNLATVPIIALTALAMPGDRDRCLEAGATEYLAKPVRLKQLVTTIQHLLDRQPDAPPDPQPSPLTDPQPSPLPNSLPDHSLPDHSVPDH